MSSTTAKEMLMLAKTVREALKTIENDLKPPIAYCYNTYEYAYLPYQTYISKYCNGPKSVLFVGMNPGPYGMCQTGIPFGEVNAVKNWLKIDERVDKPARECPGRKVLGFSCPQSEKSGFRLWTLFEKICGTPDLFFNNAFVHNYCPLGFLKENGWNATPEQDLQVGIGIFT